jgi:hypothetical protein
MKPNQENRNQTMDPTIIPTTPATPEGNPPNVEVRTNRGHTELTLMRTGGDPQAGSGIYVLLDDEQTRQVADALVTTLDGRYVPSEPIRWAERVQAVTAEMDHRANMVTLTVWTGDNPELEARRAAVLAIPARAAERLRDHITSELGDQDRDREVKVLEDRVDTLTSDLDEARAEERERTLERDHWEVLCIAKDELLEAVLAHLDTVQGQAADWKTLQLETAGELNAAMGQLHRAEAALEAQRYPRRYVTVDGNGLTVEGDLKLQGTDNTLGGQLWVTPTPCGDRTWRTTAGPCNLPADLASHRMLDMMPLHTDGRYSWTDSMVVGEGYTLAEPDRGPQAQTGRCGNLSVDGIGGEFQPARRCHRDSNHMADDDKGHSDGLVWWDRTGHAVAPPQTL